MKLNYFSLPSRFWRYVRIVTLSTVCIFALGVIGVSYGMWYADGIIRNATRDLNLGYPGEARYSLETLSSDSFHKLFLRLHLVDDEELMRVRCAASVSDAEYEQAVAVCTQALSYAHGSAIRNEIRFNRAAAYIRLTFLGMLPKGMSLAIADYKEALRTDLHSRAAAPLEKLNLLRASEVKGKPDKEGGDSRPAVPMFDESPSNGAVGEVGRGY